jgi:hypothetical protein
MAPEATQLNSDSTTSTLQQRSQGGPHRNRITGHAEIGPVEVVVGPRRIPQWVEIQTEIWSLGPGIGMPGVKRNGGDLGPIGQHDGGSVHVQVKPLMIVVRESALCRFVVRVPVELALRTHDDGSDVGHPFIVASAESATSPGPLRSHGRRPEDWCPYQAHQAADRDHGSGFDEIEPAYIPARAPERRASGPNLGGMTWSRRHS